MRVQPRLWVRLVPRGRAGHLLLPLHSLKCDGRAWVVTRYPDGTEVHAHPQHGPEDVARAAALGYPNVDLMTLAHDPLHSLLCFVLLCGVSPTLNGLAHGRRTDPALADAEEQLVLAAQRFLQLARKSSPDG